MSSDPILPSDAELVARAQQGDIEAYDQLIVRYQERIYSVIYGLTSNHEDTNDAMMEVFEKAYRSLPSFKGESAFYTWLYRVAMNRTFNFLEKRKKFYHNLSLNDLDIQEGIARDILDPSIKINPEKQAELKELQKQLNDSLQKLSKEHRAVVVLFDVEGLSHAEIAEIMQCSEGTVRSRLHYAHKQLQRMLARHMKELSQ